MKSSPLAHRSSQFFRGIALAGIVALAGTTLGGCSDEDVNAIQSGAAVPGEADISVVASFYPLAYLAERIGGDAVVVTDLTPPGGHAHDLELSPRQVAAIGKADVVMYLGDSFQPAVDDAVLQESTNSLDGMEVVDDNLLLPGDAHIWLDPMIMADLGDALAEQLSEADPGQAELFESNAQELREELEEINLEYEEALAGCKGETLITSHQAFGYMAQAYGLNQVGVTGINPDAEPSPKRIRELEQTMWESGATTLFFEAQTASATEQKLADALGVGTGHLETLESAPFAADDYVGALRANLEALRSGLECAR